MFQATPTVPDAPTVFLLHFLGGSARAWREVVDRFGAAAQGVPLDLPGFGEDAAVRGYDVSAMADRVAESVRALAPRRWAVAGHSMGAKVAAMLARRAEDGEAGLAGLCGVITLAGSPPSPEPMAESRRESMMGWLSGPEAERRRHAEDYAEANAVALPPAARALVVEDVLRAAPEAWKAWLARGSREDCSARIGVLRTPALILAGEADEDLGPDAQRALMAPHFAQARLSVLPGAKHLLPLEAPEAVARQILAFLEAPPPAVPADYLALLGSEHTGARLRAALLARAAPDDPDYRPAALDEAGLATLRALMERVLPQPGPGRIDLAARLDQDLSEGPGDGWRHDTLPPDAEALRAALRTLDALSGDAGAFADLTADAQDALLARIAGGEGGPEAPGLLDGPQLKLWFGEVCAAAARLYVSHPAALARMGYGGVAAGGDGTPKGGFTRVGIGERDAWEPATPVESRP